MTRPLAKNEPDLPPWMDPPEQDEAKLPGWASDPRLMIGLCVLGMVLMVALMVGVSL